MPSYSKPILATFMLVFILSTPPVTGQSHFPGPVLYIQGGYLSSGYLMKRDHHELISASETSHHKCIILNAGILVPVNRKWRAGFAFTYDHFGTRHRSVEYSNLSYMVRCDNVWMQNKNILFYSGLAAGIKKTRRFEEDIETGKQVTGAVQVIALGMEWRLTKWFSATINAGYGVSGLINAGGLLRF